MLHGGPQELRHPQHAPCPCGGCGHAGLRCARLGVRLAAPFYGEGLIRRRRRRLRSTGTRKQSAHGTAGVVRITAQRRALARWQRCAGRRSTRGADAAHVGRLVEHQIRHYGVAHTLSLLAVRAALLLSALASSISAEYAAPDSSYFCAMYCAGGRGLLAVCSSTPPA